MAFFGSMMRKDQPVIYIFFVFLAIILYIVSLNSDKQAIKEWSTKNGYVVLSVEEPILDNGPYWFKDDDQRIYRCRLIEATAESNPNAKTRTMYMRTGVFSNDYEFYDKD